MGKSQCRNKEIKGRGGGGAVSHLEQADTGLETRNNGLSEKLDLGIRLAALFEGRGAASLDLIHWVEGDCVQSSPVQHCEKAFEVGFGQDSLVLWKRETGPMNTGFTDIV